MESPNSGTNESVQQLGVSYPIDFTGFADDILQGRRGRLLNDGTLLNHYGPLLGWQRYRMHQALFILGLLQKWDGNHDAITGKVALRESRNLLASGNQFDADSLGFPTSFTILGYKLSPIWYSALTQSFCASAFCRVGVIDGDDSWIEHGKQAMRYVMHSRQLRTPDPRSGGYWYQEYPTDPPTPVLNGHMYAVIGFLDVGRASHDQEYIEYFEKGISALCANLPSFDANGLALYDAARRILAKPYYQRLHVKQLRFLEGVTGEPRLGEFADKWEKGFQERWGMHSWTSYAEKTLQSGLRLEGVRFPLSYLSYALGDSGFSIVPKLLSLSGNNPPSPMSTDQQPAEASRRP